MERQEVDERYKVDSTKGGSLINPVSYKGDVMVQVWMDSRVLATLCKWLESKGEYPRFLSHVVRMPLEMLVDHFVEKEEAEMVDDTLEARTLLEGRFHVSLNKGRKGIKNLMHNVTLSGRRGTDLGKGGAIDYTRHSVEEPVEMLSQEEVRAKYFKGQKMKEAIEAEKKKARDSGLVVNSDGTPLDDSSGEKNRQEVLTELEETYHRLETIEGESPMKMSQEEVIAKHRAEIKGEVFEVDSGPVVKEGMNDEEYEAKMEEIAKRDRERLELENASFDANDLPMVDSKENDSE